MTQPHRRPLSLSVAQDAESDDGWSVGPHPFITFCEAPGTAQDDHLTMEQWERRRAMVAMALNPALNIDRMPEDKPGRRGRPKGSGQPPRPTRMINGVLSLRCCEGHWQPVTEFYRSGRGYQSRCKFHSASGQGWKRQYYQRQAEQAERETCPASGASVGVGKGASHG